MDKINHSFFCFQLTVLTITLRLFKPVFDIKNFLPAVIAVFFIWYSLHGTSSYAQSTLVIDSVSVNENNHVFIAWTLDTEQSVGSIEVHRQPGINTLAGRINILPPEQSYYLDTGIDASDSPYLYYVVALSPGGSTVATSLAHGTPYLFNYEYDICNREIIIDWSDYLITASSGTQTPLPTGYDSIFVWRSFESAPFEKIVSLSSDQESYVISIYDEGEYCFRVQAIQSVSGVTSTSNYICLDATFAPSPDFAGFRRVSLDNPSMGVEIDFIVDVSAPGASYILERFNPEESGYTSLDTIFSNQETVNYYDENPLANTRQEFYRIEALDSCLVSVFTIEPVSTVYAEASQYSAFENRIEWNSYDGWENGVSEYVILRRQGQETEFTGIAVMGSFADFYIDDVSGLLQSGQFGEYQYRIQVIENASAPESVLSNITVIEREAEIFIPNAFKPNSQITENRIFQPVFLYFTPQDYSLFVFNRWGEQIFSTDDVNTGWDGMVRSREAPAGIYTYVISYKDSSGRNHERKGALMLVR